MKIKTITIPLYTFIKVSFISLNKDENTLPKKYDYDCLFNGVAGVIHYAQPNNINITVAITIKNISVNSICHELYHLTNIIMQFIGHENLSDDEAGAYLQGYLSEIMFSFFQPNCFGKNKSAVAKKKKDN